MRKLTRRPLSPRALTLLAKRTAKVLAQSNDDARAAEVERLWQQRSNRAFQEIRGALEAMASGLVRCMYCEDSLGTDIEHFHPKRLYPAHAFEWSNYLLACSHCNSNEKRTLFPLDEHGQSLLIDPTVDDPSEHLLLSPTTGRFGHLTRKGEESIKVFGLSRETLETGRKDAWHGLVFGLIPSYAEKRRQGTSKLPKACCSTSVRSHSPRYSGTCCVWLGCQGRRSCCVKTAWLPCASLVTSWRPLLVSRIERWPLSSGRRNEI